MTRCCAGPFNKVVFTCRYFFFIVLLVAGIGSAALATQMGPLTSLETMLNPDHPLMTPKKIMISEFVVGEGSPSSLEVSLTWGVKGMDRSSVGRWESANPGVLEWDDEFTVAPRRN